MRTGLFAAALALFLSPALAPAGDPAVVYQTQPLGRLLDDLRTTMQQVGGDDAVKRFNDDIKKTLGDKGFDGFDLTRPIVGYIDVPADLTDTVAVVAFPVTGEKEWLEFVERWNKAKPKALKDGVYEVPGPGPNLKAAMRVTDGYAYVAAGAKDPARVLDPKALVPFGKMYDPTDVSLMAGRVFMDRLPKEVRAKAKDGLEQLKKMTAPGAGATRIGMMEKLLLDPFLGAASRWLDLSEGAKEAVLRINADAFSGEAVAELTVTPAPGSPLEKAVGGIKPATNRFAALVTPDSVGGLKVRLPLDIPEVKDGMVKALETIQKEAANNAFPPMKGMLDELFKGLIRTAKTGEMDAAAALRGPDQNGNFTGVGAFAFDDPSAFEKEFKKFTGTAPQEIQNAFKWDAEKVNGVSIHVFDTSKLPGGDREMQALFGQNMTIAFAYAPKAVYAAVGPGEAAVKAVKEAMAVKPVEAPTVEAVFNADRIVKLVGAVNPQGSAMAQKVIGKTDKLVPALAVSATGGKDLKVKLGLNVKLFGSMLFGFRGAAASAPVAAPLAK